MPKEMAQQLLAQGQKVGLLALMDSPIPSHSFVRHLGFDFDRFCRRLRGRIRYLARRIIRHPRNLLHLSFANWPAYFREKARTAKELAVDRSSPRAERFRASRLTEANRAVVDKANQRAMRSYHPRTYPGRVSLFLVSKPRVRSLPDPRMAWAELASDGAEVYVIPGDHHDLLREPSVQILAQKLDACLHRTQSTP